MEKNLSYRLDTIIESFGYFGAEIILAVGIALLILVQLIYRKKNNLIPYLTIVIFIASLIYTLNEWLSFKADRYFQGLICCGQVSWTFIILINIAGILTVLMSMKSNELKESQFPSEYFILITSAVLGAHLLCMTTNFVMVFISLELLSISSYVLAGYHFSKKGAESSLKYFLFGSVASAIMLYGFSILFGLTGQLDFSSTDFFNNLLNNQTPLLLIASLLSLAGFFYKIAAAPMHPWAPDVYEAAPVPVVAFLSIVPKLAGLAVLIKFSLAMNLNGKSNLDWQMILSAIAILSITVGNFSALWQNNPKRMMAYSSIAQTGFLLIGIICFSLQGVQFMLFYSAVYMVANFAVFYCLQIFENNNIQSIPSFSGWGRSQVMVSVILLIGFISLAGIPPTAGFTAKLFIFTSLWDAYEQTGKVILVWLLVFGLINTVVSLFYYLRIPYFAFMKTAQSEQSLKNSRTENYLALILVVLVLILFIRPDFLMGWLNRITFVL